MNRIVYADYLKIIGILGVIDVHFSGDYLSSALFGIIVSGLLYSSFTHPGAILFKMISGLLLFDRPKFG